MVGGGAVAADKANGLLDAGAVVHVVATTVGDALRELADVTFEERAYRPGEAAGYRFVVAATDDPATNALIYRDCESAGVWVNAADDPANGSAMLPARVRRGDVLVTVSTGGRSPALSRWLRRRLDGMLEPELADLVEVLATERDRRHASGDTADPANWQRALDSGMLELIREGRLAEAKELLQACLSSSSG